MFQEYVRAENIRGTHPGGSVWMPIQDYKPLRVAVIICVTLVNTQTDTKT